ncbi:hypothetical protein [Peribacillus muralis]|uniref:hypothetical protein n=1 Tax=Peribacillus muralis TaxID=264697 RepID=UPI00070A7FB8|nr:hypothetical protein [Peribacillus muralis]
MIKILKSMSNGIVFAFLYLLVVFISPIFLMLMGYTNILSNPALFGEYLYLIEIKDQTFSSEATIFGCILSFVVGLTIHFFLNLLIASFKKGESR